MPRENLVRMAPLRVPQWLLHIATEIPAGALPNRTSTSCCACHHAMSMTMKCTVQHGDGSERISNVNHVLL